MSHTLDFNYCRSVEEVKSFPTLQQGRIDGTAHLLLRTELDAMHLKCYKLEGTCSRDPFQAVVNWQCIVRFVSGQDIFAAAGKKSETPHTYRRLKTETKIKLSLSSCGA